MTRLDAMLFADGPSIGEEEVVLEMLATLQPADRWGIEQRAPAWLERMRETLHERYTETLRVSDLADEAGVHPVHAARVFRRHTGRTIGAYVRQLRIEHACAALADPERPISAIAFQTGFSDQAHLTRRFKELTGFTPGRYRDIVAS